MVIFLDFINVNLLFMKSVVIIMLTEHCYHTNYYRYCNLKMFDRYWLQSINIRGLRHRQKYILSDPLSDPVWHNYSIFFFNVFHCWNQNIWNQEKLIYLMRELSIVCHLWLKLSLDAWILKFKNSNLSFKEIIKL